MCSSRKYIHTPPTEGIGISWGGGSSVRLKILTKCKKLNTIGISRGVGVLEKIPSAGKVWIFSGNTQSEQCNFVY